MEIFISLFIKTLEKVRKYGIILIDYGYYSKRHIVLTVIPAYAGIHNYYMYEIDTWLYQKT